jgi:hypothetical protein
MLAQTRAAWFARERPLSVGILAAAIGIVVLAYDLGVNAMRTVHWPLARVSRQPALERD